MYDATDGRMVLSDSQKGVPARQFPVLLHSALFFALFFLAGIAAYSFLRPVLQQANVPLADARLSLVTAVPTTAEGVFRLLLSATRAEGFSLCFLFLTSFTFFAPLLTRAILAIRALSVASALCRLRDWAQAGAVAAHTLFALYVLEALICAVLILYAAKAVSVSRRLRLCDRYRALPIFKLVFSHLFTLALFYFATLFGAGALFLITRL